MSDYKNDTQNNKGDRVRNALQLVFFLLGLCICVGLAIANPAEIEVATPEKGISLVDEDNTEALESSGMFGMLLVGQGANDFYYYRDSVTDVMYLWKASGYKGGLTIMIDPETGLPLTYTRYMELANVMD